MVNYIKFDFSEDKGWHFPRRINVKIQQGTMSINRLAPPNFLAHIESLKKKMKGAEIPHAMMKLHSLIKEKNIYDILITFNRESIERIKSDLGGDISFYNQVSFYLKKKLYGEFLKFKGETFLKVYRKDEIDRNYKLKIKFKDSIFHDYLLNRSFNEEQINGIKASLNQGIHEDFIIELRAFLKEVQQGELKLENELSSLISDVDLDSLDIRTKFTSEGLMECELRKKAIKFALNEALYEEYLIRDNCYDSLEQIKKLKNNSKKMKGIAEYFLNVNFYVEDVLNSNLDSFKKEPVKREHFKKIQELFEGVALSDYDFDDIEKRTRYLVSATAIFMDNNDILITLDPTLEVDYSTNLVNEEIDVAYERGLYIFNRQHGEKIKSKELSKITNPEFRLLKSQLQELRLETQKDIHLKLIKNSLYYTSVFKKNIDIFSGNRFKISDKMSLKGLPILLGIFNSFFKYYPKSAKSPLIRDSFMKMFFSLTNLKEGDFNALTRFSRMLLLFYLSSESLKSIARHCRSILIPKDRLGDILSEIKDGMSDKEEKERFWSKYPRIKAKLLKDYSNVNQVKDALSFVNDSLVDSNFKNKEKLLNEIEDLMMDNHEKYVDLELIRELSGNYIKIVYKFANARYDILAAGAFGSFILALNIDDKVSLNSISKLTKIDPTSLHRQVKKMANAGIKLVSEIKSLEVRSENFRKLIRYSLIRFLVKAYVGNIMQNKGKSVQEELLKNLSKRLKFFNAHDIFKKPLHEITPDLLALKDTLTPKNKDILSELADP